MIALYALFASWVLWANGITLTPGQWLALAAVLSWHAGLAAYRFGLRSQQRRSGLAPRRQALSTRPAPAATAGGDGTASDQ